MKHGDISNRQAPIIAFRVEDFLLKKKDTNLIEKVRNVIQGNYSMNELNLAVVSAINFIFRGTDMSAYLVVDEDTKFNEYEKELLDQVNYSSMISVAKPVEITVHLMIGEFTYYVDSDLSRMSKVNHKKCITLSDLNQLIRGH